MSKIIKVDAYSVRTQNNEKGSLFMAAGSPLPEAFKPHTNLIKRNITIEKGRIGLPTDIELMKRNLDALGYFVNGSVALQNEMDADRVR